jgi:hypothetical protein
LAWYSLAFFYAEHNRDHPIEADDGEGGRSEAVFAGILGGAGLAVRGAVAIGLSCIGAIGGELFRGNEIIPLRFEDGMEAGLSPKLAG